MIIAAIDPTLGVVVVAVVGAAGAIYGTSAKKSSDQLQSLFNEGRAARKEAGESHDRENVLRARVYALEAENAELKREVEKWKSKTESP